MVTTILLLIAAIAPSTRPVRVAERATTGPARTRVVVQVRAVEYQVPRAARPADAGGDKATLDLADVDAMSKPALGPDAKELSSLQVTAAVGDPFDCTTVVNGTTYQLAGAIRARYDNGQFSMNIDYS